MAKSEVKKRIRAPQVQEQPDALKRWSNCLRVGNLVFISGMVGYDEQRKVVSLEPIAQCRRALSNVRAMVEAAGGTMDHIVRTTVWLTNIRHRPAFLQAREEAFKDVEHLPTVTLVGGVDLASEELLVEVDAIAWIPESP